MADGLSSIQMWGKREGDISLFKCLRLCTSRKGGSRRENSLGLRKHKKIKKLKIKSIKKLKKIASWTMHSYFDGQQVRVEK